MKDDTWIARLAGQWYPGSPGRLVAELERCFLDAKNGPGVLPGDVDKNERASLLAILSPHAGYTYSGAIAAYGYMEIAKDGGTDTFVLIGTHGGFPGAYLQDKGAWESPLGRMEIDEDLAATVAREVPEIKADTPRVMGLIDNTMELQLPFMQHVAPTARLVPIAVGSRDARMLKDAATGLSNVLAPHVVPGERSKEKRVVIVVSTDLTHYGPHFAFMPAAGKSPSEQNSWVRANDSEFVKLASSIVNTDTADLLEAMMAKSNVCCPGAVTLGLETVKQLGTAGGGLEATVLRQATSHDVDPRPGSPRSFSAVGYVSMAFKRPSS